MSHRHHSEIYVRRRCIYIYIEISSYETGETLQALEKSMNFRTNFISHDSYPLIRLRHQIFLQIYVNSFLSREITFKNYIVDDLYLPRIITWEKFKNSFQNCLLHKIKYG